MKTRLLTAIPAVIALAAYVSVCAANESIATERNPTALTTYHAVVSGDLAFLKAFHASLQQVEGVQDLLDNYIMCTPCKDLGSSTPPTTLEYFFFAEHVQKPRRFFEALDQANRQAPSATVKHTILIERKDIPGVHACPSPTPPQCGPQPMCAEGCDGDVNVRGCQLCPR